MRISVIQPFITSLVFSLHFVTFLEFAKADTVTPTEVDQRATQVYQDLLSPFCPGRSLKDCPSSKAEELKNSIKLELSLGQSSKDVYEGVIAKFGEQYRAVPKNEGFGRLVWLAPLFFLVGGGVVAITFAKRKMKISTNKTLLPTKNSYSDSLSAEQRRVLEEELSKLQ